jgi:peroxiredoxin
MSQLHTTGAKPIEIGDPAPDFSLPRAQGGTVSLEQSIKDGPVLLWFAPGMV